jgi:hypothetical protein
MTSFGHPKQKQIEKNLHNNILEIKINLDPTVR